MRLTPEQIKVLMDVIDQHYILFSAQNIGVEVLTNEEKRILTSSGIDLKELKNTGSYIDQAYKFGILSDAISDKRAKKMKYGEFLNFVESGKFIPLNQREEETLSILKDRAYNDVRVLGGKTSKEVKEIILNEGMKTISERGSLNQMVSQIGHAGEKWDQDFGRISDYVLHYSFDHGRAANITRGYGGGAQVYKDVYAGACRHCIRLYLTAGIGSAPKLFPVQELVDNGTNIGVKAENWMPVVGATHPWCRCTINHVPEGFYWDEEKQRFVPPKNKDFRLKRESKVQVTIGDETKEI